MSVIAKNTTCPKHGEMLKKIGASFICSACMAEKVDDRRLAIEKQYGMSKTKVLGFISRACVPPLYRNASFENFFTNGNIKAERLKTSLEAIVGNFYAAVNNGFRGMMFIGHTGTGKTHLGCAMINSLVMNGIESRYVSMPAFTREFKASCNNWNARTQMIENLVLPEFLMIDEIDLHGDTNEDYQVLYEIINRRYESGSVTLATSNRDINTINRDLHERITERILNGTSPVIFDWPSFRSSVNVRKFAK